MFKLFLFALTSFIEALFYLFKAIGYFSMSLLLLIILLILLGSIMMVLFN